MNVIVLEMKFVLIRHPVSGIFLFNLVNSLFLQILVIFVIFTINQCKESKWKSS